MVWASGPSMTSHSPLIASTVLMVAVSVSGRCGMVVRAGTEHDLLHSLLGYVRRREDQEY